MPEPGPISRVSSAPPSRGLPALPPLLALPPLALLAEFLVKHTHHRPLGAVVFATAALSLYVLLEIFVRLALSSDARLSSLTNIATGSRLRSWARRICWTLGLGLSTLTVIRALLH
jgi:hypothetical protein